MSHCTLTFTGEDSVRCLELSYASVVRSWQNKSKLPHLATGALLTQRVQTWTLALHMKNMLEYINPLGISPWKNSRFV